MASVASNPTVKVLLCGNGSVGKSSIIRRLVDDGFDRVYKQTIGCDFYQRSVTLKGDHTAMLQVWDIGGQSIASDMLGKYFHGSAAILLCYDITDAQSFADLEDWLARAQTASQLSNSRVVMSEGHAGATHALGSSPTTQLVPHSPRASAAPSLYLVGNKIDLVDRRQVTEAQHEDWIRRKPVAGGFTLSARTGDQVLRVFYSVAADALGITLTDYELGFLDRVVKAKGVKSGDDEARTALADEIEAEDRAYEAAQAERAEQQCVCALS